MRATGPIPSLIAIVGEAPGAEEERVGEPFVGSSGRLLTDMLHAAGIMRSSCFITNVCRYRPPGNDISLWFSDNKKPPYPDWLFIRGKWVHPRIAEGLIDLERELAAVKPSLVIALGGTALWALTPNTGILKWRGSRIANGGEGRPFTVVPALHPAAVLRQLELAPLLKLDFTRALNILEGRQKPREYQFTIQPSFAEASWRLDWLHEQADKADGTLDLGSDVETRLGVVACYGFAWNYTEAVCIPILQKQANPFYWSIRDEATLRVKMNRLFHHPKIRWIGQNFLYDCQYFVREGLGYPTNVFDTMIGHHSIYANTRKGLDFLSSLYAHDHVYWKDESKNWDPALGEKQFWTYNCKDGCITLEVKDGILAERDQERMKK